MFAAWPSETVNDLRGSPLRPGSLRALHTACVLHSAAHHMLKCCEGRTQVREETGFDIRPLLVEQDCIEMHIGQQRSKLFIITGVRGPVQLLPCAKSCCALNFYSKMELSCDKDHVMKHSKCNLHYHTPWRPKPDNMYRVLPCASMSAAERQPSIDIG